jgi:hypothetical protein
MDLLLVVLVRWTQTDKDRFVSVDREAAHGRLSLFLTSVDKTPGRSVDREAAHESSPSSSFDIDLNPPYRRARACTGHPPT